jgi:hypothetical protein
MLLVIIGWALFVTVSGAVTNAKGRGWALGAALGGLLGVVGLVIAAMLRPAATRYA